MVAEMAENLKLPLDSKVVDFACGTGLAAACMSKKGFTDFVGLDASSGMIAKAKEKNIYREFNEGFLGCGQMPAKYDN
jgi:predicted TPR repeat methyltransferase